VNKSETGAPYPVMNSVTGDPVASLSTLGVSLGSSAETNGTTPVAGTELEVRTGQRASSSYENAANFVCGETSRVENQDRQSCCYEQRKLPSLQDGQSCCHKQRKLPGVASSSDCRAVLSGPVSEHVDDC